MYVIMKIMKKSHQLLNAFAAGDLLPTLLKENAEPKELCIERQSSKHCQVLRERSEEEKLRKFAHMSKLGVPYLPCSLVWTKISLDKHSSVYPTYLPKEFGHFGTKVCSCILDFDRNLITHSFRRPSFFA